MILAAYNSLELQGEKIGGILSLQWHNLSMQVISTVILQLTELALALVLLQYSAISGCDVRAYFVGKVSTQQSWIKEAVLGFGLLLTLVLTTSILFDKLIGPEVRLRTNI